MQIIQGVPNHQSYIQDMREFYQKFPGDNVMQIQKGRAIERTISSTNIGICVDEALKSGELRPKSKARKKVIIVHIGRAVRSGRRRNDNSLSVWTTFVLCTSNI